MCECLKRDDGTWHVDECCAEIMDDYHAGKLVWPPVTPAAIAAPPVGEVGEALTYKRAAKALELLEEASECCVHVDKQCRNEALSWIRAALVEPLAAETIELTRIHGRDESADVEWARTAAASIWDDVKHSTVFDEPILLKKIERKLRSALRPALDDAEVERLVEKWADVIWHRTIVTVDEHIVALRDFANALRKGKE